MKRKIAWLAIACVCALACASGKAPHHRADAAAAEGPQLVTGLAPHHHPIATDSAEAQAFFDQGFA